MDYLCVSSFSTNFPFFSARAYKGPPPINCNINHWATALVVHFVSDMKVYSADSTQRRGVHRDPRALPNLLAACTRQQEQPCSAQRAKPARQPSLWSLCPGIYRGRSAQRACAHTQSDQSQIRDHFVACLRAGHMSPFPCIMPYCEHDLQTIILVVPRALAVTLNNLLNLSLK